VLTVAHCEDGTQLTARVPPELAAQLAGASVDRANAGSVAQTHHLAGSRQNGETA
jgi:hypothetical protein